MLPSLQTWASKCYEHYQDNFGNVHCGVFVSSGVKQLHHITCTLNKHFTSFSTDMFHHLICVSVEDNEPKHTPKLWSSKKIKKDQRMSLTVTWPQPHAQFKGERDKNLWNHKKLFGVLIMCVGVGVVLTSEVKCSEFWTPLSCYMSPCRNAGNEPKLKFKQDVAKAHFQKL